MPQRLGTGLAVGRKVIQRGDELVAFVWEAVCFVPLKDWLHVRLLPALSLIGIKNLQMDRDTLQHRSAVSNPRYTTQTCHWKQRSFSEDKEFDLENPGNLLRLSSVYVSLCNRSHMK